MAHDAGSSPRGQRLLAVGAVCALSVATAAAFGRVFAGGGSVLRLMAVALTSALLAAALERRNLILATVVSAAGLLIVVGVVVFPKSTLYGAPTIETLRAIRDAAGEIGREADAPVAGDESASAGDAATAPTPATSIESESIVARAVGRPPEPRSGLAER